MADLSIDDQPDYEDQLRLVLQDLVDNNFKFQADKFRHLPSVCFGIESALLDLKNGGRGVLFNNSFVQGKSISINALIWMDEIPTMLNDAYEKIKQGAKCIKFKVGAKDFDAECRMLEQVRKRKSAFELEIRIDANGSFMANEALEKIKELSRFEIHSIEQPIAVRQYDDMSKLCREAAIDVALDEELIGMNPFTTSRIISELHPKYLIIKPNLLGGFNVCDEWLRIARKNNIGWWSTSALESNIGLNAIAQWSSEYNLEMPQGLGTGDLYTNNIHCGIEVRDFKLFHMSNGYDWKKDIMKGSPTYSYG